MFAPPPPAATNATAAAAAAAAAALAAGGPVAGGPGYNPPFFGGGGGGGGRHLASNYLPPNILQLFSARPPLQYAPPPTSRKQPPLSGVGQYVDLMESREEYEERTKDWALPEKRSVRIARMRAEKQEKGKKLIAEQEKTWDPNNDPNIEGNSYKTLFVARMSYLTDEHKLKREMEAFGPVKKVRLVYDKNEKPRGYGFVEFEHEKDMRTAYKQADGMKIDGRRIIVDVERGRTVKGWRPRRLGGGLGSTRVGAAAEKGYKPPKPIVYPVVVEERRPSSGSSIRNLTAPSERHFDDRRLDDLRYSDRRR